MISKIKKRTQGINIQIPLCAPKNLAQMEVIMKRVYAVVLIILIPVIAIIVSFNLMVTKTYLMSAYGHYDGHDTLNFDYNHASINVVYYLNGRNETLIFPSYEGGDDILMTERGIMHMEDVFALFQLSRWILGLSLIFVAVAGIRLFQTNRELLAKVFEYIYILPITVIVFLLIGIAIIGFDEAFTIFHELFFSNDLWILSYNDPLIKMYPQEFFMNTGIIIVVLTVIFHLIIMVIGFLIKKRAKIVNN